VPSDGDADDIDTPAVMGLHKRWSYMDPVDGDPRKTLQLIVQACEEPDLGDDSLLWAAVFLVDPLLDCHWSVIGDEFEAAMRISRPLRKAWSGAMVDIPQEMIDRLDDLLAPDENIGGHAME
jgi:hypothetical protein